MDKRIRLGFVYLWDESWLGGVYYAQNLLKALDTLDEEKKPIVHVYCLSDKAFDDLKSNTGYPYMEKSIVKQNLWKRVLRQILNFFVHEKADNINILPLSKEDDVIYPWSIGKEVQKMLYWVADFQTKYFPDLFNKKDILNRDAYVVSCCKRGIPIVFSSYNAQRDFYKFFPDYKFHRTYVVHFATSLPDFSGIDIKAIRAKYHINKSYLFCSNQFWKHKNHMFLFKAFKKAIDKGLSLQLVCTGNMNDYRNPAYIHELKKFISDNHLEQSVLTLGMIDKMELYCLMKNSYAVIQPSLFEGWNTTVEDCKAMSKFVFLSELEVHKEQLEKNVCFFDPYNEEDLANKLLTVFPNETPYDYTLCVKRFGEEFYEIIDSKRGDK